MSDKAISDTAPAVWPVNTDYSTHRQVINHRHVCPTCQALSDCPNPWLGEPCQAVEWFEHSEACAQRPTASSADLEQLTSNLHMIAPGYRHLAVEAVPTA